MKVPYNWLKTYIDFPYSPEELAHKLTMAGLEVEDVEYLGQGMEGIIVGEITEISEHPNADKLVICQVDTGHETLQIITGAPNVLQGAKVPVAPTGVTLPNGLKIEETILRGKASRGMICSEDELGLIEERAEGIMILDEEAEVGTQIAEYLARNEYVLKLDLTPNYARCLGLLGIARELKADLADNKIKFPENNYQPNEEQIKDLINVEIKDPELCSRYTGILVKNVDIKTSPEWMQLRLKAAGIRPINNIVDITNYVLLEYNQPLHAFDYDKISGRKIIVRRASKDEKIVTLDEQERVLDEDILVIADEEKAVGLAGVMGGANSEITEESTSIFIESAYFNPVNIRKTARRLSLPSEASHRFERGVDIENVLEAGKRAAYLMQKLAGGEVVGGVIDQYPVPYKQKNIVININRVNRILGLELKAAEMKEMLERLEFKTGIKANQLKVEVPSYRNDVELEADLIEEIARMYGYNNIPVTCPDSKSLGKMNDKQKLEGIVRNIMTASGLNEIVTFSLMDEKYYDLLDITAEDELRKHVRIKNPLNQAFSLLRTSLFPGLLEVLANNARRQVEEMKVFELGKVFFRAEQGKRPREKFMLAGGSMGCKVDYFDTGAPDFYCLKGIIDNLFNRLDIRGVKYKKVENSFMHPGRTAGIEYNGHLIGILGELRPGVIEELDLITRTSIFELDFAELLANTRINDYKYAHLPKHPAVSRDLALVVDENIPAAEILEIIKEKGTEILKDVKIFDLYQGDQIPEGSKSLAFKLNFQSGDRTLIDKEVKDIFNLIISTLKKKINAEIRGN